MIHQNQPILTAGKPLTEASAAMIMIHGRGASAESILTLADEFQQPDFAYLAPQAAENTWYPQRFIVPVEQNEPYLSSALQRVGEVIAHLEQHGIPAEKIILLGFSQGACLAVEYAARHAKKYGGVAVLSGGLIGEKVTRDHYMGNFEQTPIFLGCSDQDFHVPAKRVHESTLILQQMGADVTERLYPDLGHTINQDEIEAVQQMMIRAG
ncbi:MAG: dienelactone hydrolase family protein [Anaerolineae bacterium]|nr:dienelactone hydrolase family protein [Anaerolineae bacterium]